MSPVETKNLEDENFPFFEESSTSWKKDKSNL